MEIFIITLSITLCVCLGVYWFAKYLDKDKDEDLFADFVTKTVVKPTTVTCEDCKCEIKEENACKVRSVRSYNGYNYYCQSCKPNYSRVELEYRNTDGVIDYVYCYYKELEVTKDGEPVGYKKK